MTRQILLEALQLRKSYGDRILLQPERLCIYEGERIGLVGENGAGKSTLLSILAGEQSPDSGTVRRSADFAVIHQLGDTEEDISSRQAREFNAGRVGPHLSGGEKTRRRIAAAFSREVPLLFADEPTTDLDAEGIALLKKHLTARQGALLLISHDRELLNLLCDHIWYLEDGKITEFTGNYSAFQAEMQRRRDFQQFEYDQYRAEQQRLKASIQKQTERSQQVQKAPSRMGNSEARLHKREATDAVFRISRTKGTMEKRLDMLEKKDRPRELPQIRMQLGAGSPIGAKNALQATHLSITAGQTVLLRDAHLVLPTGSRTVLTGPNGCGKTTLLRILQSPGLLPEEIRFDGQIRCNNAVRPGWFDQDHSKTMNPEKSALENAMATAAVDESTVRTTFAGMNMRRDEVFKPVGILSGGERAKAALVRLLVSDANVLFLDEPTNHLDVFTLEALEDLLKDYAGTLLFVSHDRTFASAVATRTVRFENKDLVTFEGTPAEQEQEEEKDRSLESLALEISTLQMRMAAVAARLSAPKKGDRPEALNEEYNRLAEEIRLKKKQLP